MLPHETLARAYVTVVYPLGPRLGHANAPNVTSEALFPPRNAVSGPHGPHRSRAVVSRSNAGRSQSIAVPSQPRAVDSRPARVARGRSQCPLSLARSTLGPRGRSRSIAVPSQPARSTLGHNRLARGHNRSAHVPRATCRALTTITH